MMQQYVVHIYRGNYESADIANLVFYLQVNQPWSALELAKRFKECLKLVCDGYNKTIEEVNEGVRKRGAGWEIQPLSLPGYLREVFRMQWHESGNEWDFLQSNGWDVVPSTNRIAKVVHLSSMDVFLAEGSDRTEPLPGWKEVTLTH